MRKKGFIIIDHICVKCNILMSKANLDHSGSFRILKKTDEKVGFFGEDVNNLSRITQFVFPQCGYIEFYAEEPQKFK